MGQKNSKSKKDDICQSKKFNSLVEDQLVDPKAEESNKIFD